MSAFYIVSDDWRNAVNGIIQMPSGRPNDVHCVVLYGCSIGTKTFQFRNSWGQHWGVNGSGELSFDYFEKCLQEAYFFLAPENPNKLKVNPIARSIQLPIGLFDYVEVRNESEESSIGWIIVRRAATGIEVHDLYVRPEYRRQGHATRLLGSVIDMARDDGISVFGWVGLADTNTPKANIEPISRLANKFNLHSKVATVKWAKYFVTTDNSNEQTEIQTGNSQSPNSLFDPFTDLTDLEID